MNNERKFGRKTPPSLAGIVIIIIGVLYLLRQFDLIHFHSNLFWGGALLIVGFLNGMKRGFMRMAPIVLIFLGLAVLTPKFMIGDVSSDRLVWPVLLILAGIAIAARSRRPPIDFYTFPQNPQPETFSEDPSFPPPPPAPEAAAKSQSDLMRIEAYFGGRKEIITSKEFRGCNVTAVCGGAELNLMQADSMVQPMVIDLRVMFGGVEIIVPSHWEVVNEVDVLLGGVEDKRNLRIANEPGLKKTLVLRGSVTMGGLELKSY